LKQPLAVSESASSESLEKINGGRTSVCRGHLKSDDSGFQSRLAQPRKPSTLKSNKVAFKGKVDSSREDTLDKTDFEVTILTSFLLQS